MFGAGPPATFPLVKLSPGAAVAWTLLVPGSAHAQLGSYLRAALAFLTSVGLFFAGYAIVGDRVWYFQLFEPFAFLAPVLERVPVQLLPEAPNLGCCIALSFLKQAPGSEQGMFDWLRMIRVPMAGEHLGLFLMGITGVINALWAADAHWLAQRRVAKCPPALAAAASWVLPGAGHWLAGQKNKGVLVGVAVLLMFALGLLLSSGHAVDRPLRSAWWIPQVLVGSGTAFTTFVTAPLEEGPPGTWIDHGVAMCAVAGFMNLIVMIDAYTVAEESSKEAAPEGQAEQGVAA